MVCSRLVGCTRRCTHTHTDDMWANRQKLQCRVTEPISAMKHFDCPQFYFSQKSEHTRLMATERAYRSWRYGKLLCFWYWSRYRSNHGNVSSSIADLKEILIINVHAMSRGIHQFFFSLSSSSQQSYAYHMLKRSNVHAMAFGGAAMQLCWNWSECCIVHIIINTHPHLYGYHFRLQCRAYKRYCTGDNEAMYILINAFGWNHVTISTNECCLVHAALCTECTLHTEPASMRIQVEHVKNTYRFQYNPEQ